MRFLSLLLAGLLVGVSVCGCRAAAGVVAGPIMGGPSLTGRFYRQDVPHYAKLMGTPFVFLTGALTGPLVCTWRGFNRECEHFPAGGDAEDYFYILDPFDAGFFGPLRDPPGEVAQRGTDLR